jgi:RES domain-containing protein
VRLTTFRLANLETPLWAVPNFNAGRYNRAGTGATQYLSLHPMTPWAEILRNEDRRTPDRALMLRYPLWAVRVELAEEPLELSFATATEHGLSPEDLVADNQSACRGFGERLRETGARSFTAPSAALPGTRNLVILEPAVITFYDAEPVGREDLPTAMADQDGRCPDGLWDLVHYRGAETPHPALEAWSNGDEHAFEEPPIDPRALVA